MKKFVTLLLAATALLSLAAPAKADVLWEPMGNAFYDKHWNDCVHDGRNYYANGQDGFVTLWNAPDGHGVEGQFENGAVLYVYWIYEDWGYVYTSPEGWVPLADLQLIYDQISFEEDHADRITPYNGEFADYAGGAKTVNFYEYPGAEEIQETFVLSDKLWLLDTLTGTAYEESCIESVFVDESGLTWGFVPYMDNIYGRINAWFCLEQPDGENFPTREGNAPDLIPARTPVLPAVGYVPYLLVGAVVLVTAGLLLVFFRKKKK